MEQNKQRIVVKVGTSTLTHNSGALDLWSMEHLVRTLADLQVPSLWAPPSWGCPSGRRSCG